MEILKFDESGSSSPTRKRSGRGAILVTFVALVFGAGTALASGTLTVNNTTNTIQLAQAVATTSQCDDDVTIGLETALTSDGFKLSKVNVSNILGACVNKYMTIKVYPNTSSTPMEFCTVGTDVGCFDSGRAYALKIEGTGLGFAIGAPSLLIATDESLGRVSAEITDNDPNPVV
jgi:hypothetical protein